MRLLASVLVTLGLLCPFVTTTAIAGDGDTSISAPDERSADEIIRQVAETYKNCRTYRDSGVVTIVFINSDGRSRTDELPFTTAFVRPDRFRYEFQHRSRIHHEPTRYIVWSKGQDVRTWWDITPGVKTGNPLHLALAGATGVSGRSAWEVPSLLLPKEVSRGSLEALQSPTRLEDAKLGEVNCIRIQGESSIGDPMTFWIDSKTLLIRRIDSGHEFGDFRTEQTMTYDDPIINEPIPEEKLAFDPPTEDAAQANLQ
jgi:outer membrane lipoprotein-sorting protein